MNRDASHKSLDKLSPRSGLVELLINELDIARLPFQIEPFLLWI
jgi:hypothetical protein